MFRKLTAPLLGAVLLFANPLRAIEPNTNASLADIPALLDTLLKFPDNRTETIKKLLATQDENLEGFFQNLYKGNVYQYLPPGQDSSKMTLVIGGPEENHDGETWVPLLGINPMVPIKNNSADGAKTSEPLSVKLVDLVELETDREIRQMVQPVLTAMDLKSEDLAKRKAAALTLGENGDSLIIPLLIKAKEKEKNSSVIHLIDEAKARIELHSPNPDIRSVAAVTLGKIHSANVLPELKRVLNGDASGTSPEQDPKVQVALKEAIHAIESWNVFTGMIQNIFSGISLGSILILMALGLAIIFGLMGVINMAHGEFMMIGAYATYLVQCGFQKYLPAEYFGYFLPASFPIAFLAAGSVGMIVEMIVIKRLYGRPLETLLATWGISLLFIQTARTLFGDLTAVSTPTLLSKAWEIFPQVSLPYNRIFIIFLTILIVSAVSLAFYQTTLGTKIRAVTQNRSMSSCLGIATRKVDALTFGLGTGIAGIAGCALTQIGNVDPGMGQNYIVDSFMVVVTGGVGKLAGTVISGFCIGSLNKYLEPFLQSVYAKVVLLGLVILFLQIKPSGLFPAKGRNEDN